MSCPGRKGYAQEGGGSPPSGLSTVKCCKDGAVNPSSTKTKARGCRLLCLPHLHGEGRLKRRAAQLSYLADVLSHGVVIQPGFGLELLFAVLTLQGILQLKELKAKSPWRPQPTLRSSMGCGRLSLSPMGAAAAAAVPSGGTQQTIQRPCPPSPPTPACGSGVFSLLSWILLSNPYASIFGKHSMLDVDLKPHWLETSGPGVLIFL